MEGKHKRHPSLVLWQAVMNAGQCVTPIGNRGFVTKKRYFFL